MRHILMTTDAVGGAWSYTISLAAEFAQHGVRSTIATLGPRATASQRASASAIRDCRLLETGLELDWVLRSRSELEDVATSLGRLSSEIVADSVHLHAPCLASLQYPVPVVAVAHSCIGTWWRTVRAGELPPDLQWHRDATYDGLCAADAVIAPSRSFADLLTAEYGRIPRLRVVYNGLPHLAAPSDYTLRSGVLAAGRLWDDAKGMSVLDDAVGLAGLSAEAAGANEAPDGHCFTPRHLSLLGNLRRDDLRDKMLCAAVFASPSIYEPFGLGVLEAAQCGTALVLSDIPVFRELWEGAAVLAPAGEAAAWAKCLRDVADDRCLQRSLGARARARSELYSAARCAERTLLLHEGLHERRQAIS